MDFKGKIDFFQKELEKKRVDDATSEEGGSFQEFSDNDTQSLIDSLFNEPVIEKKNAILLPKKIKEKEVSLKSGHRQRVKEKFIKSQEMSTFLDYEILEMMLFSINPRIDVKDMAKKLIANFKDLKGVLNATKEELQTLFTAYCDNIYYTIKLFKEVTLRVSFEEIKNKSLSDVELKKHVQLSIGNSRIEQFMVIFIDTKNNIIQEQIVSRGTIDEVAVYIRNVLKTCISIDCKNIIISHNHPSGDVSPSFEDMKFTDSLKESAKILNIRLIDHVIVSDKNSFSFKDNIW